MKIIDAHLHLFPSEPGTDAMAEAVGGCRARKFLVPMNSCGVVVAGVQELTLSAHVRQAVDKAEEYLGHI